MPRLSLEKKEVLVNSIKKGDSINQILKELRLAKSTIYYYYKKIKGRKYKLAHFYPGFTKEEGEIVGIFTGDGSQYFYAKDYKYEVNIHFGKNKLIYLKYVKKLFDSFFNKSFYIHYEKGYPRRLRIISKKIFYYFQKYINYSKKSKHNTVKLSSLNYPKEFMVGFLKGLLDTDGCIYLDKKNKRTRISYYTTSKNLADQIQLILEDLDIKTSVYVRDNRKLNEKTLYHVSVLSKSINKYLNIVKPFKARMGK